ncbi:hypothetical protein B0T16DRAFT_395498 [Cercophora newfieldiana]|uniref:Uncharacterized protein n=1 Tax=Cercophora newfieldiana TaxID=92897 RepID=A0AA40CIP6_9PEZI|nr:hypothetical protein B0T16DRAFT_395498 [Cercophora newfieldiana]
MFLAPSFLTQIICRFEKRGSNITRAHVDMVYLGLRLRVLQISPPLPIDNPKMRVSQFLLATAFSHFHMANAQSPSSATSDDEPSWESMTDPADRTYPTTITNTLATTHRANPTDPLTIDQITLLDPWPTSPDPQSVPFTMTQTAITTRTISPLSSSPTTTILNTTVFYKLWTIQAFDMPPYQDLTCPGPNGCVRRNAC